MYVYKVNLLLLNRRGLENMNIKFLTLILKGIGLENKYVCHISFFPQANPMQEGRAGRTSRKAQHMLQCHVPSGTVADKL